MFSGNRADMREVFFRAWQHYREQRPLEGIEKIIVDVALQHPEYHGVLEAKDLHTDRDYSPMTGENPFVHMGLHIAIAEQLTVDQPPGVRACYQQLRAKLSDPHRVEHAMMECLGETVWQAAQARRTPDHSAYLDCLRRLVR